MFYIKLQR